MATATSNELFNVLHRLMRLIHRSAHRSMRQRGGLYHQQAHLLHLVAKNDGSNQRDLAEQMDVRPSSMTEMLTKLEQAGLITRKQDEQDQRVMRIYLTDAGKQAAEQSALAGDDFVDAFFNGLTEEEKAQMLALLEKLCQGLEANVDLNRDESPCEGRNCHNVHHHHGHHHDPDEGHRNHGFPHHK